MLDTKSAFIKILRYDEKKVNTHNFFESSCCENCLWMLSSEMTTKLLSTQIIDSSFRASGNQKMCKHSGNTIYSQPQNENRRKIRRLEGSQCFFALLHQKRGGKKQALIKNDCRWMCSFVYHLCSPKRTFIVKPYLSPLEHRRVVWTTTVERK